jgi:hypothetical protein
MWKEISKKKIKTNQTKQTSGKTILLTNLCWEMEKSPRRLSSKNLFGRVKGKIEAGFNKIEKRKSGIVGKIICSQFRKDEEKQSIKKPNQFRENEIYKRIERIASCLGWGEGWKWSRIDTGTGFISFSSWVGIRSESSYRNYKGGQIEERFSSSLQNRYSKQEIKIGGGDRREETSDQEIFIQRFKKRDKTSFIRVENIEIYKRGSNEQSFSSIISNNERSQSYAIFYDLEVENHPSYFVENCPVHNCHQLTGASLEGLLHFLEEPPKDVYIVLTTTEPDKLKVTIKRRCFHGEVTPLIRSEMNNLFKTILKKEKKEVDKEVLDKIIKESDGSPGMALKYLDMVLDMDKDQGIEIITKATKSESSVIDLCRTLLDPKLNSKSRWKNCQEILKTIDGEPESIRRGVLGYMTKVMLSDSNASVAANTASNFTENYYDSGKAGLVLSVYLCCTE